MLPVGPLRHRLALPFRQLTRLFSLADTSFKVVYPEGKFRSDAIKKIAAVPVIEVKGKTAVCDGGGGALGHPIEYIQLDTVRGTPGVCKYCGLRFKMAEGFHGHH